MLLDFGVRSKKWSFLINPTRDFGVIIPESIDNLAVQLRNSVLGLGQHWQINYVEWYNIKELNAV